MTTGDQKIWKKICPIFQKVAQTVSKAKIAKIFITKLNMKAQKLHQTILETLKYLQQAMYWNCFLGENVIN